MRLNSDIWIHQIKNNNRKIWRISERKSFCSESDRVMNNIYFLNLILPIAVCFVITVILSKIFIPVLKSIKMGQKILDIGPRWHKSKEGTPTMGGLFFIAPVTLLGIILSLVTKEYTLLIHIAFVFINGCIGFTDDYVKFFKKQNAGLSPSQKMVLQFSSAAIYIFCLNYFGCIDTGIAIPFTHISFDLPLVLYCILAAVGIVFTVNSVNLTDGIDGLASSITAVVMIFMAVLGVKTANAEAMVVSGCVIGGTLGFLVYNFHPARVFMGDTGSLFLGAAVSSMAFILNCPLLIFFAGFMYYVESVSVIIQVWSYKTTGKRVFKMTPIHHHFEMSGWGEIKIVIVFSAVAAALCAIGCFGFLPVL